MTTADWDGEWDPALDRRARDRRMRELGMEQLGFYGLIRYELMLFEARMDEWAKRKHADDGVGVHDWRRAKHRSRFRALLIQKYGAADVPPEWEAKLGAPNEDDLRAIRARARSEFG